jgi:hypothetical protein
MEPPRCDIEEMDMLEPVDEQPSGWRSGLSPAVIHSHHVIDPEERSRLRDVRLPVEGERP